MNTTQELAAEGGLIFLIVVRGNVFSLKQRSFLHAHILEISRSAMSTIFMVSKRKLVKITITWQENCFTTLLAGAGLLLAIL